MTLCNRCKRIPVDEPGDLCPACEYKDYLEHRNGLAIEDRAQADLAWFA
jgi:RNA polymerase subunit RPABC4/transcription elongation factor Spt4